MSCACVGWSLACSPLHFASATLPPRCTTRAPLHLNIQCDFIPQRKMPTLLHTRGPQTPAHHHPRPRPTESSGVICGPELERPGARIACAQRGHVISAINSAFYGTSDDTTCRREFDLIPSADVIAACRAGAPNYQEAVEADCLGRSACDLRYHPRQGIQDPCPTFTKWAQVDFTCSPASECRGQP